MVTKILLTAIHRSPYLGGLEQAFLHLLDGIPREEFEIAVALMPGMGDSLFGRAVQERGARVVFINDVLSKRDLAGMWSMVATLRRERPDICHIHMTHPVANPFLQIAAWLAGVPIIIATEQTNVLIAQKTFGRLRKRFTGHITDVTVAVSHAVKRGLCEHYGLSPKRVIVIENAIDAQRIAQHQPADILAIRQKLGIASNSFLIGTVAAMRDQKGHAYLLRAAPYVLAELPQAVFLLIGDGDLRPALEREARNRGVADRVIFAGWRNDVIDLLYALDLFVLPSLWEGLPLSVLEAMAAARPVVATAVDGTAEVIQNEVDGLLVPPANPTALSQAILRVAHDLHMADRLRASGRAKVLTCYDAAVMTRRYVNLYRQQLAQLEKRRI